MDSITSGIPGKTVERLSEYRRSLMDCHRQGITHIFSHVLAGIHGITAVQVRRDLMLIGFSSDTKKGYDVKVLIDYISNILDGPEPQNMVVLGMGHIGQAISRYCQARMPQLNIVASFDTDPQKVGRTHNDIPCYHSDRFEEMVTAKDVTMVMLSVPGHEAQQFMPQIINAGIRGVLNFTSAPLHFPGGIIVENFDITTILDKLVYFVKESENNEK